MATRGRRPPAWRAIPGRPPAARGTRAGRRPCPSSSPAAHSPPEHPRDLLGHRLLAFSHWERENHWRFVHTNGTDKEQLTFRPRLSMNDYAGLAAALLAGTGIGDLPPVMQPDLLRDGRLVEVMPNWRFPTVDLSVVHVGGRHVPRAVRVFKEFAVRTMPTLFPGLPA